MFNQGIHFIGKLYVFLWTGTNNVASAMLEQLSYRNIIEGEVGIFDHSLMCSANSK